MQRADTLESEQTDDSGKWRANKQSLLCSKIFGFVGSSAARSNATLNRNKTAAAACSREAEMFTAANAAVINNDDDDGDATSSARSQQIERLAVQHKRVGPQFGIRDGR